MTSGHPATMRGNERYGGRSRMINGYAAVVLRGGYADARDKVGE